MTTRLKQLASSLNAQRGARGGLVALGAVLAACSSLLGIEDLSTEGGDGAKGGSAGQAGSSSGASGGKAGSSGGASAAAGKSGSTGKGGNGAAGAGASGGQGGSTGGSGGSGGSTGGSGGTGGSTGGSGGTGGTDASGGEAGSTIVEPGPVNGTIIDFWGHKLAGLEVKIGDKSATTDLNGKFSIPGVDEKYDVAFVVRMAAPARVFEWVYLGLTRRDPTLQCKNGFTYNGAHFYVTQMNGGTFDAGLWYLSFGSADGGNDPSGPASSTSGGFDRRPVWYGPDTTNWTLHSLFLEKTGELPTGYVAYGTESATSDANDVVQQDFSFDLSPQNPAIDTGNVSGGIVESSGEGRTNSVFVRFSSGAAIPVVDRAAASASAYEYLVPDLSNGKISVAAAETHNDESYAIAHRDQNQVGDTGVDIVIPPPVSALVPVDNATGVGPTTPFTFNAGDPKNSGYLVYMETQEYQQGVYIVTTDRQVTLDKVPVIGTSLILPDAWHFWYVETHGQYASVDAMAGTSGFLDTFTLNDHLPQGPSRADGAYTQSVIQYFRTSP
jgi:hypothetical protein